MPPPYCSLSTTCTAATLCERCLGRELVAKHPMAGVLGQCWAERLARTQRETRGRETWVSDLDEARRLVASLGQDPRLVAELVVACDAGAAAWWARRPAGYRA